MERVIFPDIEDLLTTYLPNALHALGLPIPVGTKVPNPRPTTFVRLMRTGGTKRTFFLDNPQVTVEAWADDETDASALAELCRGLIGCIDDLDGWTVYDVGELSGPVNLQDPTTSQARYTATYTLLVRGHAA